MGCDVDSFTAESTAILFRAAACCQSFRPAAFIELAAFCCGSKPALRLVLDRADLSVIEQAAQFTEIDIASRPVRISSRSQTWSELSAAAEEDKGSCLVAISRSVSAEDVISAELNDPVEAGFLLGYPDCCVRALGRLSAHPQRWPWAILADWPLGKPLNARLNRFAAEWGGVGLLGELFPCSHSCELAYAYAQNLYMSAMRCGLEKLADKAKSDALRSIWLDESGAISVEEIVGARKVEFTW